MSRKSEIGGRRKFLKDAVMAGGATAVAVASGGALAATPESESEPKPAPESSGYRVTPHVKTYYDKARF